MSKFQKSGFLLIILSVSLVSYGQDLSNKSFEQWFIDGLNQHPIGWTSSNDFSLPIGPAGVSADSSSYDGYLAAKIVTTYIGFAGAPYAGFIVNGKMNVSGHYDIDSIHKAGEPFPYRPDALSGYYKYNSDSFIEDWGHAFVLLKKYDSVNQKVDTIGYGENTMLNPSTEYRYFQVDIEYFKEDIIPDSIVVAFFSTYPRSPTNGGELWIDNLSLEYATNIPDKKNELMIAIYPNPASSILRLSGPVPEKIKIYNSGGEEMFVNRQGNNINVSHLSEGLYILTATLGDQILSRKFIKR